MCVVRTDQLKYRVFPQGSSCKSFDNTMISFWCLRCLVDGKIQLHLLILSKQVFSSHYSKQTKQHYSAQSKYRDEFSRYGHPGYVKGYVSRQADELCGSILQECFKFRGKPKNLSIHLSMSVEFQYFLVIVNKAVVFEDSSESTKVDQKTKSIAELTCQLIKIMTWDHSLISAHLSLI